MGLARCLIYMALWGLVTFPLGRLFKRMGLRWDRWPFAARPWERGGRVYEGLGVRAWKDLVPDVSKVFPSIVPRKEITGLFGPDLLRDMLAETCVAELVHDMLIVAGLALPFLWPGPWGIAVLLIYVVLGNLPFIIIQRYNRPRFGRLLEAAERRERRLADAGSDTIQQ